MHEPKTREERFSIRAWNREPAREMLILRETGLSGLVCSRDHASLAYRVLWQKEERTTLEHSQRRRCFRRDIIFYRLDPRISQDCIHMYPRFRVRIQHLLDDDTTFSGM